MDETHDALLLVDLQAAFFEAPGLAEKQAEVVAAANALADSARANGVPILLITTEHSRDRSTWTLNMLDDDQGFLFHGDDSTAVVADLVTEGMTRVEKTRDSAWFGTDLSLRLRNLGVGRIVLAGVSTHGCIAQTTRDAYAHNVRTTLVTDAIADERREYHEAMIEQLAADRQADLRTLEQVTRAWDRDRGRSAGGR